MRSLLLTCLLFVSLSSRAQLTCDPNGNLVIFTNYDGGTLNINVDVNIPNLKIGICSYEAVTVNLTGAFVSNVTEVKYAGYNGANNTSCGTPAIATTTINGAPTGATVSTVFAPPSPLPNSFGYGSIICGYSCSVTSNQGGCNTIDQIEAYFIAQFTGSVVRMHKVQYGCWPAAAQAISAGGTCCLTTAPNPVILTITPTHTTCFGGCNGSVTAMASGGTPPYSYQWTGGPGTATWGNRCAGVYTVVVTDNSSATASGNVTVTSPPQKGVTLTQAACDSFSFDNVYRTVSGVFKDTMTAFNGCDSIITLNLTINTSNVNVTQLMNTLSAAATGATYQWLNCDSNFKVIAGATSQSFTPTLTGNYAVKVTQNGCTDTSTCNAVVITDIRTTSERLFKVYPNPAGEEVTIEVSADIRGRSYTITDNFGRTVAGGKLIDFRNNVSLQHLTQGVYMLRIEGVDEARKIEKL